MQAFPGVKFLVRGAAQGCVIVAAIAGWTAAAGAKPLDQALEELLRTHPRVLAAEKDVSAAREGAREADAGFLPRVSLSGDSGYERVDSVARRSIGDDPSSTRRDSLTLSVTQKVFDGFATPTRARIGELGSRAAEAGKVAVREAILYRGIEAYLSVLRESEIRRIAEQNERTLETELALEEERRRQGGGLLVDVLQTQARLQIARERLSTASGRLEAAVARYVELFDEAPQIGAMSAPPAPDNALPATVEAAVETGRAQHPALARSDRQLDIASERRRLAHADYYPDLDLVLEGSWENDIEGINGIRREQRVLLRGRWDLFDGFARDARVARAGAQYGATLNNHLSLVREVSGRIRRGWSALTASRKSVTFLRKAVEIARQVFDARRRLRRDGRESLINVLDAERELNLARQQLTRAEFNALIATYRVLRDIGQLEDTALAGR